MTIGINIIVKDLLPTELIALAADLPGSFLVGSAATDYVSKALGILNGPDSTITPPKDYDIYCYAPKLLDISHLQDIQNEQIRFNQAFFTEGCKAQCQITPEFFMQSSGTKNKLKIDVTWGVEYFTDTLLCSGQCAVNILEDLTLFRDQDCYNAFIKRELYSPDWDKLFYFLASDDNFVSKYAHKRINFLFRLYTRRLSEGWTLSKQDETLLKRAFASAENSDFLTSSYRMYRKKNFIKEAKESNKTIDPVTLANIEQLDLERALSIKTITIKEANALPMRKNITPIVLSMRKKPSEETEEKGSNTSEKEAHTDTSSLHLSESFSISSNDDSISSQENLGSNNTPLSANNLSPELSFFANKNSESSEDTDSLCSNEENEAWLKASFDAIQQKLIKKSKIADTIARETYLNKKAQTEPSDEKNKTNHKFTFHVSKKQTKSHKKPSLSMQKKEGINGNSDTEDDTPAANESSFFEKIGAALSSIKTSIALTQKHPKKLFLTLKTPVTANENVPILASSKILKSIVQLKQSPKKNTWILNYRAFFSHVSKKTIEENVKNTIRSTKENPNKESIEADSIKEQFYCDIADMRQHHYNLIIDKEKLLASNLKNATTKIKNSISAVIICVTFMIIATFYIFYQNLQNKNQYESAFILSIFSAMISFFTQETMQQTKSKKAYEAKTVKESAILLLKKIQETNKNDKKTLFCMITTILIILQHMKRLDENIDTIFVEKNHLSNFLINAANIIKEDKFLSIGRLLNTVKSSREQLDRVHGAENLMMSLLYIHGENLISLIFKGDVPEISISSMNTEDKVVLFEKSIQKIHDLLETPINRHVEFGYHIPYEIQLKVNETMNTLLYIYAMGKPVVTDEKPFFQYKTSSQTESTHPVFLDFQRDYPELTRFVDDNIAAFVQKEKNEAPKYYDASCIHARFPDKSQLFSLMLAEKPNEAIEALSTLIDLDKKISESSRTKPK